MKENQIIIGLWGLTFNSGNMGCNALSHSFLDIINRIAKKNTIVYVFFQGTNFDTTLLNSEHVTVFSSAYNPRSLKSIKGLIDRIKKCNICFDFTAGDSFSDIYGLKGFLKTSLFKILSISHCDKFVLGPQTYGPYYSHIAQTVARYIIKKSTYACARDEQSAQYIKDLFNIDIDVFTDVAFLLHYNNNHTIDTSRIKVGINVSGLLWNGGYNQNNQFDLTLDYRRYINEVARYIINDSRYELFFIPHVITPNNMTNIENDYPVCLELSQSYTCLCSPKFSNPIQAKNYISEMDLFIGSRMHATIGAFSSGVATIPVSYSRKFEGLYHSLGYEYLVNARVMDTDKAIATTLEYINKYVELKRVQADSMKSVNAKLDSFVQKCRDLIYTSIIE